VSTTGLASVLLHENDNPNHLDSKMLLELLTSLNANGDDQPDGQRLFQQLDIFCGGQEDPMEFITLLFVKLHAEYPLLVMPEDSVWPRVEPGDNFQIAAWRASEFYDKYDASPISRLIQQLYAVTFECESCQKVLLC